jgi:hypothetical protein
MRNRLSLKDPRWALLEQLEPILLQRFDPDGVTAVRFIAWFSALPGFSVWLCTSTDIEREALHVAAAQVAVRQIALSVGFSEVDEPGVVAQSQETVDRDFEGSWFYAMR